MVLVNYSAQKKSLYNAYQKRWRENNKDYQKRWRSVNHGYDRKRRKLGWRQDKLQKSLPPALDAKTRYRWRADALKMAKGGICTWCANNDLRVLHFDHRHEPDKSDDMSAMIRALPVTPSPEQLRAYWDEANKCRLLCANCHMLRTNHDLHIVERKEDCIILGEGQ